MANAALSTKPVGTKISLNVDGAPRNFIIVHQGNPSTSLYDASCNGTWLLLEYIYENRVWDADNSNVLENSDIHTYLNNEWIKKLDANIQTAIKQVKLPYRKGGGSSGSDQSMANGLLTKIFLLSGIEVGFTKSDSSYFPNDGAKLAYFTTGSGGNAGRVAKLSDNAAYWWLRSPGTGYTYHVWGVYTGGGCSRSFAYGAYGVRPALILPSNLLVSDDGKVTTNTAPTMPASITVPPSISGGTTINLSWAASTDAEQNLAGYKVEVSTNGGGQWTQIYQGTELKTTYLVVFGTESVMFRVKAYDAENLESAYKTSGQVMVVNNRAPGAPASISVPNTVNGGSPLVITWGPATDTDGNLSGYQLERQVDGAGEWTQVYKGDKLTATDQITKGWNTVTYRVRAYDDMNVYGPYATSQPKTVNNNTAPVITCGDTNLGEKSAGFTVSYSVQDEDQDQVTVTEAIDGQTTKTHQPSLGDSCTFSVEGDTWQKLLNGEHSLTITANDGVATATHKVTFTKKVTEAVITLTEPLDADDKITLAVLSVVGSIPQDADFKVEVTNNAKDDAPKWEDATTAVKNGANIVFTNDTATAGFAFNFKVTVKRGPSDAGGYIQSVQGGFQ